MMSLSIRDARDDERDAIRDLTLAAYAEYAALLPRPFWEGYQRNLLATLDAVGPVVRIVAERAGTLVGSVLLYPPQANAYAQVAVSASWPEVRLMAVAPSARGQGIGTVLLRECARRARHLGATTLGLHTMDVMQAALRLYEREGFVRAPELDFRPAADVLVKAYRLSLSDGWREERDGSTGR
jgi:GNAT superfamily N-acetyltransferase